MLQTNKNFPYYLTTVGLFIIMKWGYKMAESSDLKFLIKPTDTLVGILTGSNSVYLSESGYYHEHLNIIIDKSCSGFNFWILCFVLFSYLALNHIDKTFNKVLVLPSALMAAYVLTLFVNTSRIFASIVVQKQTQNTFAGQQPYIHEAIGVATNLTFLVLAYLLIEKILIHLRQNAKFI